MTSETFGGCDCDCAEQLDAALARIAAAGRGVRLLPAPGRARRGIRRQGARPHDRAGEPRPRDDVRRLRAHGARSRLPPLRRRRVRRRGARHHGAARAAHQQPRQGRRAARAPASTSPAARRWRTRASPFNLHYLAAKSRSGHALERHPRRRSPPALPEAVARYSSRRRSPARPRFLRVASYLLPIRGAAAGTRRPLVPPARLRRSARPPASASCSPTGAAARRVPLVRVQRGDVDRRVSRARSPTTALARRRRAHRRARRRRGALPPPRRARRRRRRRCGGARRRPAGSRASPRRPSAGPGGVAGAASPISPAPSPPPAWRRSG